MATVDELIAAEVDYAAKRFGPFRSTHEGYGVLSEEVAELLEAIHANDLFRIRKESCQVAAVAIRIAHSLDVASTRERSGICGAGDNTSRK